MVRNVAEIKLQLICRVLLEDEPAEELLEVIHEIVYDKDIEAHAKLYDAQYVDTSHFDVV